MQYNVQPGVYETISNQSIGTFTLNVVTNFKIDGDYSFLLSDIVIKQGTTIVSASNYTLSIDTTATTQESGQSAKTLYGAIKITNATYAGVELNVSGSNFGTYTDNQATVDALTAGLLTKTEAVGSNIEAGEIAVFAGTGQNIESDNSGEIALWETGTVYNTAGTLVRLAGKTFTATGKATNQGFNPTVPANKDYWLLPKKNDDLVELAYNGEVVEGNMHPVNDRSHANYAQNIKVDKKQIDGVDYEFHYIHLDATVVTGNATLEALLTGYPYIDKFAPDVVGTRTLIDMSARNTVAMSVGGENDVLGGVIADGFQGHAHIYYSNAATADNGGAKVINDATLFGVYETGNTQYPLKNITTDDVNGAPRTGLTTHGKQFNTGADYIIVMLAV